MLHVIKDIYKNPNEARVNTGLMNRDYEKNLEDYVIDCFKSIELVLDNIKMTDYTFTIDVDEIDMSDYERSRRSANKGKNKKPQEQEKIAFIKKSMVGELSMNFLVTLTEKEKALIRADEKLCKKRAENIDEDFNLRFNVKLLVPIVDDRGRYLINGVLFNRLYQLTEASTYITPATVVLKSIMPIMVKRGKYTAEALDGTSYTLHSYKVLMFKSFMNVLYFYLATKGWEQTLQFLYLSEYLSLEFFDEEEPKFDPRFTYFKINAGLAIKVDKRFLVNKYIQSMIGTILDAIGNNRYTYDQIMDKNTWVKRIGTTRKKVNDEVMLELGNRYLLLFNRMYDLTIKDALQLTNHNKKDIYAIIRWIIQNYDDLRAKDNLDYMNKRLRGNEQYGSLLNEHVSGKIKKLISVVSDTGEKIINKYKNFFCYYGRELISRMHSSGLIRNEDIVNDMDMFARLRFTRKGPNALGNKNSRNVSSSQRAIHPSEIGIDSLCTCSASDPGLTNYVNPLCETDGLLFKGRNAEPESFYYDFINEMRRLEERPTLSDNSSFVIMDPAKLCDLFSGFDDDIWEEP